MKDRWRRAIFDDQTNWLKKMLIVGMKGLHSQLGGQLNDAVLSCGKDLRNTSLPDASWESM